MALRKHATQAEREAVGRQTAEEEAARVGLGRQDEAEAGLPIGRQRGNGVCVPHEHRNHIGRGALAQNAQGVRAPQGERSHIDEDARRRVARFYAGTGEAQGKTRFTLHTAAGGPSALVPHGIALRSIRPHRRIGEEQAAPGSIHPSGCRQISPHTMREMAGLDMAATDVQDVQMALTGEEQRVQDTPETVEPFTPARKLEGVLPAVHVQAGHLGNLLRRQQLSSHRATEPQDDEECQCVSYH